MSNFKKVSLKKSEILFSKRQKIVIASIFITVGLLFFTQLKPLLIAQYQYILGLSILAYLLSLWALWEGMSRLKAVVLLTLPTLFTLGLASFYFLLPVRWLTRLPVAIIFGLSFYSLLLSQNVFNVASERTIPLYRAASTVAFLFTLITIFFLFNVVFALKLNFYLNGLLVFLISFPLILQTLWSIEMEQVTSQVLIFSFILSLVMGEFAIAFSFWPIIPTIWSLTLSTMFYCLLGLTTQFWKERLSLRLVLEYLGVGGGVLIFTILTTSWVG
ncbi:hypothetical protein HY025_05485 [Candidatus Daviesbacteria bacterium]|nr:hypothetical protein [Candidatus Daviesbacteria bacterium]